MFKPYMHIEKLDTVETEGILDGECFVFPKIDGTNGSIWLEGRGYDAELMCASRKRVLSADADNAGFYAHVQSKKWLYRKLLDSYPEWRLYGEWLVPHAIKGYSDHAWRKFYVFDVFDHETDRYVPYREYNNVLNYVGIDYIPPQCIVHNPELSHIQKELENNWFLFDDKSDCAGEGLVVKNYDFTNRYGRTVWGKLVTNRFKEAHAKSQPTVKKFKTSIEKLIVEKYVTPELCEKTYHKIVTESDGWSSKMIPKLLGIVSHDLIVEDMWDILKKFKNPTIDFKVLMRMVPAQVKMLMPHLF